MERTPYGDTHALEPRGILARGANEGETPKSKSWRAQRRFDGAELLAALNRRPGGEQP